jgi:hypothetical protein
MKRFLPSLPLSLTVFALWLLLVSDFNAGSVLLAALLALALPRSPPDSDSDPRAAPARGVLRRGTLQARREHLEVGLQIVDGQRAHAAGEARLALAGSAEALLVDLVRLGVSLWGEAQAVKHDLISIRHSRWTAKAPVWAGARARSARTR